MGGPEDKLNGGMDWYQSFIMMTSSNENISALLALCEWNPSVTSGFPAQRPVMRGFDVFCDCPACRTSLIATRFWVVVATRFWVVVICPIIKCLTVLKFSFILFNLCLFITIFNFILNCVPIVTFWIFTYHKIWILLIIFCFIWNY